MKKAITLIYILTTFYSLAQSSSVQWAKSIGGTQHDYGNFASSDASGNIYTIGYFEGTMDFDPGPGVTNLTSLGNEDIFILKLNATGNFVWAKRIGGTLSDVSFCMKVDPSGDIYATGSFKGTVDFDPGTGVVNLSSTNSDIFILKLNSAGNFLWAKDIGGTSGSEGYSINTDASGNIFVTGSFNGTLDFDPNAGVYNLTSTGNEGDLFILKLNATGNFVWAKQLAGVSYANAYSIGLDGSGNSYTTGFFDGTTDFDPGTGVYNLTQVHVMFLC
jgi:hypothetical protein